ncbi:G5 domain-containing protein [Asanoa hainanensis]|uniref:G5 domain-containing protein n=2 Tax=Asanoa hainanensis TaxID=560556 RepID=A0A239LF44_9ACTN|nr:G5 domain-containing protein [Asanoa hainanensis]
MAGFPFTPPVRKSWWARLPTLGKAALIGGAAVVLCCGGLATVGAIAGPPDPAPTTRAIGAAGEQSSADDATGSASPASESVAAAGDPSPTAEAPPTIEKRTVTETAKIPYTTRRINDSTLAKGTTKVTTHGVAGVKTLTYEVTLTNGVETGKKLVRTVITKAPVTQVTRVGTKAAKRCDPNYSGCVPIASDVDCAGGSGNGPAYVQGPVRVIGSDIYDLDRDGDGIACD